MEFQDACNIAYPLHSATHTATGTCPYCSSGFDKHDLMDVCQAVECDECGRWFVVRTHVEVSYTTHRVEGEITRLRVAA